MSEKNTSIEHLADEFLFVNKPAGITSHDVVELIRKETGEKKVGHAGTLDPFAEGLLVVGVGRRATRQLDKFLKKDKEYTGTIYLGATSTTDDPEGEITKLDCVRPTKKEVESTFEKFVGKVLQTPPKFSAIKIKGKKAYELARKGEEVQWEPREVRIYFLRMKKYDFPKVDFETKVSSGTYVRSLARDIGRELGCGGYLEKLVRTKIGEIDLSKAQGLKFKN